MKTKLRNLLAGLAVFSLPDPQNVEHSVRFATTNWISTNAWGTHEMELAARDWKWRDYGTFIGVTNIVGYGYRCPPAPVFPLTNRAAASSEVASNWQSLAIIDGKHTNVLATDWQLLGRLETAESEIVTTVTNRERTLNWTSAGPAPSGPN